AEAVVGRDLKHLSDEVRDRVLASLRSLAGDDSYWLKESDGSPHRLFRWEKGPARWVLVVTYEGRYNPDESWLALPLCDAEWKQISVIAFLTGYTMALVDVELEEVEAIAGEPLIAVYLCEQDYHQRQFYALDSGRPVLVRIESDGDVKYALFASEPPFTGPQPPDRTPEPC